MTSALIRSSTLVLALAGATLLGACTRNGAADDVHSTVSTPGPQMDPRAAAPASPASQPVRSVAGDTAITATVKARLAADTQLSALAINVNTHAGRVALRGTAPDSAARTLATQLARGVDGVVDVDNALTVQLPAK